MRTFAHIGIAVSLAASGMALAQDAGLERLAPSDYQDRPAVFRVTEEVINPDVPAFTVTIGAFGNTLQRTGKGGFEPATFRTRITAGADADDRVIGSPGAGISHFDSYASGYLDGAEVRVYRIVDGAVELVREDMVEETIIEYWNTQPGGNQVIPVGTTEANFRWADWSLPNSTRWFTVFAVDAAGNVSEAADPVRLERRQADRGTNARVPRENLPRRRNQPADNDAPPAPGNFSAEYDDRGIIEMSWDAVDADDLAGYRIAYSDTDPSSHRGIYLDLEGTGDEPIRAGDMVIVSKSMADFDRSWFSNRIANLDRQFRSHVPDGVPNNFWPGESETKDWDLVKHDADTPVENPGEYYFEMTLGEGDTELVGKHGIPDIGTTRQDFYPVPEEGAEYVMEVWMKADSSDAAPVVFTWDGDANVGSFVGEHEIELSTEWEKYTVRFTGETKDEGNFAYFVLKTTGPGTFSFDNWRVYRADTPYLDLLPYQYENLKNSGMSALRTHGPIKTMRQTYSMRQFLGDAGQAEGIAKGNTLPQMLRTMEKADIDPWLQIEYHMSPQEWAAFAEYMAAPFDPATDSADDKPYAALRHRQGRTEPWTDAFDTIYFELSNETWNGMFRPWTFDDMTDAATGRRHRRGAVYGMFHDYVVGMLRDSEHWTDDVDDKFVHVLGGWINGTYSEESAKASETADFVTIAAYNGGWDSGEGPPQTNPQSYFNVLSQVNQTAIPRAIDLQEDAKKSGRDIKTGTYEAGPGYAMNGLNNARVSREQAAEQEEVMKSKLAGVATLDSFLARTAVGFDLDNFFTFAEGDLWKSHAKKYRGGAPHASFLPLQLFNNTSTGDMLEVVTESVPTIDTQAARRRQAVDDGPLAAVYATRDPTGDRVSVVVINRKVANYPESVGDGYTPFTLELPFNSAESITLHRMTGDPTDTNINGEVVELETLDIAPDTLKNGTFHVNADTGATDKGLPPSEVYLYVFEGVK